MSEAQTAEGGASQERSSGNQSDHYAVEQLVDEHIAEMQAESAARRRRMEFVKFGMLAVILFGVIVVIALLRPVIFDKIVPAVMGDNLPAESMGTGGEQPTDESLDGTGAGEDNTDTNLNLPVVSSPEDAPDTENTDTENTESSATEEEGNTASTTPAQIYQVQAGDTLNSIARQFNTTVEAIIAANDIPNPDNVMVGTTLRIPQP